MMPLKSTPDVIWNRIDNKGSRVSPNDALLCAGLLRRGMVCELERVLWECDCFFVAYQ